MRPVYFCIFAIAVAVSAVVVPDVLPNAAPKIPPPAGADQPDTLFESRARNDGSFSLPSFMVGTQTGQGTFYTPGLTACGVVDTEVDFIAAACQLLFDNFPGYDGGNPQNNPICGRKVTARYQGKTVTVEITDRNTACALTDLDFSPIAFSQLADLSVGRIAGMTWTWD